MPYMLHLQHDMLIYFDFFFSLVHLKPCIESYFCICVLTMFHCGMQREIRTQWNTAKRCNQGMTRTTKNLLQIHIFSLSFLNSGNLKMFHNGQKSRNHGLRKSEKTGTFGPCQNWNHGSLLKLVQCVTLLTSCLKKKLIKMQDFWKQPPKITGLCRWIFGEGMRGTNKRTTLTKKMTS